MNGANDNCWMGSLSDISILELLQELHEGKCTAMLRIGTGLGAGIVFYREGTLYRCEWGDLQGEAAVSALIEVKEGSFSLIQRQFPEPHGNVRVATPILLEAMVIETESSRSVAAS